MERVSCNDFMCDKIYHHESWRDFHLTKDKVMVLFDCMIQMGIKLDIYSKKDIPNLLFMHEFTYDNMTCYHNLQKIVQGTENTVKVDEFVLITDFHSIWKYL